MAVTAHRTRNHATMFGLARHARAYDLVAGVLARPLYRRVVADVTDIGLPAGSVVLDVGTGPGRVARLIAAACPKVEVEGVDLSPEMIARATSTAKTTRTSNVRFQVGDVVTLPFVDRSVDLVHRPSQGLQEPGHDQCDDEPDRKTHPPSGLSRRADVRENAHSFALTWSR